MVVECVDNITNYILGTSGILVASTLAGVVWGVQAVKRAKKIEGLLEGLSYKIPDLGPYLETLSGKKTKNKEVVDEPDASKNPEPAVEAQDVNNYSDKFDTINQNMDKMRKALISHKGSISSFSSGYAKHDNAIKYTEKSVANLTKELKTMKSETEAAIQELYSLMDLASNPTLESEQISDNIRSRIQSSKYYDPEEI